MKRKILYDFFYLMGDAMIPCQPFPAGDQFFSNSQNITPFPFGCVSIAGTFYTGQVDAVSPKHNITFNTIYLPKRAL